MGIRLRQRESIGATNHTPRDARRVHLGVHAALVDLGAVIRNLVLKLLDQHLLVILGGLLDLFQ